MEKSGVSKNIGAFEQVFEDLDIKTADLNGALEGVMGETSADRSAVDDLLNQMSSEMGL